MRALTCWDELDLLWNDNWVVLCKLCSRHVIHICPKIQIFHIAVITTPCTELHLCTDKLLYKTTTPSISLSYVYPYAIPRIPSKLLE
jgi:hypothetical protein